MLVFRVVLGRAYRGLNGGFLLLRNFSVAISVNPQVCFILLLILIPMFLRLCFYELVLCRCSTPASRADADPAPAGHACYAVLFFSKRTV